MEHRLLMVGFVRVNQVQVISQYKDRTIIGRTKNIVCNFSEKRGDI
jgi:hypothetical protein